MAEPYSVDDFVEIGRIGLIVHTATGPATITVVPEPDGAILAVSGPGFAHDYRLPLWALQHLEERGAVVRAEVESFASADTP